MSATINGCRCGEGGYLESCCMIRTETETETETERRQKSPEYCACIYAGTYVV